MSSVSVTLAVSRNACFHRRKHGVLRTWQPSCFTAKAREQFAEVRRCCRLSVVAGLRLRGRGVYAAIRRAASRWECALSLPEPNPCSVNDESHRLRASRCSIVCFTKACAVDMVEWHINALSDAPPPTGTHLSRVKVCRVRRDLNPDHPPCFSRTEHLLRELRRPRGALSCKSRP